MGEQIMSVIAEYGLETVLLALLINVLTGLIKLPVKAAARKMEDGTKLTRFLVFLPILLGFVLTLLDRLLLAGELRFDGEFFALWLTSSSLSLSFYAVWEKIVPSKNSLTKTCELEASRKVIEEIKEFVGLLPDSGTENTKSQESDVQASAQSAEPGQAIGQTKIILRGNGNAQVETETKSI